MNSSQDGVVSSHAEALFCSESTVGTGEGDTRKNENSKFTTTFKQEAHPSVV